MTLQALIQDELPKCDMQMIAKKLGYSSVSKLSKRIQSTIESPFLGLDTSNFDFHYGSKEFIKQLCAALAIPAILCEKVIAETMALLENRKQRFVPYIFIDTAFKRENQPIHILAALESARYIDLGESFFDLSLNDQLEKVQSLIKSHFSLTPSLVVWGDVKRYIFFYDEHVILVISPQGELLDARDQYLLPRATLELK
jgi:hypothetical protein